MRSACRMTIEEDSGRFTQRFLSTESGRFRSNVEAGRRRRAMRPKSNAPRRSDTPTLAAYTLQRFKRYPCQRFVAGTAGPRVVASLSERAIQGQRRPIMRHGRTVKERLPHRETLYGFIKVRGNPTLLLTDALQSDGNDFKEIEYRWGSPRAHEWALAVRRAPFRRPAKRRALREAQPLRQSSRLVSFVETSAPVRTMDYHFCRVAISSPA